MKRVKQRNGALCDNKTLRYIAHDIGRKNVMVERKQNIKVNVCFRGYVSVFYFGSSMQTVLRVRAEEESRAPFARLSFCKALNAAISLISFFLFRASKTRLKIGLDAKRGRTKNDKPIFEYTLDNSAGRHC